MMIIMTCFCCWPPHTHPPTPHPLLQDAERVLTSLVRLLADTPAVWEAPQAGPLQTQADWEQLLLLLRRCVLSCLNTHQHCCLMNVMPLAYNAVHCMHTQPQQ
jgi:hypothetical protein